MTEVSQTRQAVMFCPYCAEETLFPLEKGWECRTCLRAFSVTFLGLVPRERPARETAAGPAPRQESP